MMQRIGGGLFCLMVVLGSTGCPGPEPSPGPLVDRGVEMGMPEMGMPEMGMPEMGMPDMDMPDADMSVSQSGCVHCHRPNGQGLENAHPYGEIDLSCVDCHGGNPDEREDAEAAHISLPAVLDPALPPSCTSDLTQYQGRACEHASDCGGARCTDGQCEPCVNCNGDLVCKDEVCCLGYRGVRKLSTDQLDRIPEDVLQFINPGDHRVAHRGCGSSNPASGEGGCHQPIVETAKRSVMQTFAGHYNLSRFLTGMQGRKAVVGVTEVESLDHDENDPLSVERLVPLQGPAPEFEQGSPEATMDAYLPQNCPYCHTASFGKNDSPRNYRSSGCTACHMLYEADGLSDSDDPNIDKMEAGHPTEHVLTTKIPTAQCEHCHFQGARIGLTYQGVREDGFGEPPEDEAGHVSWLDYPSHAHSPDFYRSEEAGYTGANDITPPDIHCRAPGEDGPCKMDCADCHVSEEVHGDGRIYSTAKGQLRVTCTDCHGTVRRKIEATDGVFYTDTGVALKQLREEEDGSIVLIRKRDGQPLPVTQVMNLVSFCDGPNTEGVAICDAMGVDENGYSHTDSMECWTCHTQWRMNCFGCHVREMSGVRQKNHQTGGVMNTLIRGDRQYFDIEMMFLGENQRGMIDTLCPSMTLFFSYREGGETLVDQRPRRTEDGSIGFGWMPNHQHTVGRAKPCTQCHPASDGSNMETVRATFGFGQPSKQYFVAARNGEPDGDFSCNPDAPRACGGLISAADPDRGRRACPSGLECRGEDGELIDTSVAEENPQTGFCQCGPEMGCLNSCPSNMDCDNPSYLVRRCATRCGGPDDCDYPSLCVQVADGRAQVISQTGGAEGLCVYDLTQMLDADGNMISPPAHVGSGPVSPAARERAMSVTVPPDTP